MYNNSFALILGIIFLKPNYSVGSPWPGSYEYDYKKVEKIYKTEIIINTNEIEYKNSICDLHESQKAMICKKLFAENMFAHTLKIFLNKTAFSKLIPECISMPLLFASERSLNTAELEQEMYPCFGRHTTMRSGFDLDDYFNTFYVSGDYVRGILIVYKIVAAADYTKYRPFAFYRDVNFANLVPLLIGETEVKNELQALGKIFRITNEQEVQTIYLRRIFTSTVSNWVCNLNRVKKISLCKDIFEKKKYWRKDFGLNTVAFYAEEPQCTENTLAFLYWTRHNKNDVTQLMLPCFGKYLKENEPWRNDKFLKEYSVSSGPTTDSVFVHFQLGDKDSNVYHVYEFIGNVRLADWPTVDTDISESTSSTDMAARKNRTEEEAIGTLLSLVEDNISKISVLEDDEDD